MSRLLAHPARRRARTRDPETARWRLGRERVVWLTASMALVLAPHVARVPVWVSGLFVVLGLWRLANVLLAVRLPPRWLSGALGLALLPAIHASYGTLTGRSAGVALLVVLTGMKLVETRTMRDAFFVCFLGYFLVMTAFLFSQDIPTGLYMLVVALVMTANLAAIAGTAAPMPVLARLALAGRLLAQAAPVALLLFLVFPRIPGPLWGLPKDAHGAATGLDDSMTPGAISRLGLSDAVAFRVTFDGPAPEPSALYWRGPVLWHTDGRTWTRAKPAASREPRYVDARGAAVDHEIVLEPHQRRWLFALDAPATLPRGAVITEDILILDAKPVRERLRYRVRSYPERALPHLTDRQRLAALALPAGAHPRARELALGWREASAGDPRRVVERALDHFRQQPFYYTLRPPLLEGDTVDQFLFESRRGFCEFYAGAFAVLMRASGIPARVVTGYQGGEPNPLGDYVIVRQRDAHAWTEVWLEGEGWVRVDPTAAVAPSRIESGMDAAIPPTFGPPGLGLVAAEPVRRAWRRLRQSWDAANHRWNEWVLGYGPEKQRELLARYGVDARHWGQLALVLGAAISAVLLALGLWLARAPLREDSAARAYRRFCAKLARIGLRRRPSEGPTDFASRVVAERPALAEAVERITALYVEARYARPGVDVRPLGLAVKAFRP
jgi:transglutaminase-like putative cysteine protease